MWSIGHDLYLFQSVLQKFYDVNLLVVAFSILRNYLLEKWKIMMCILRII